MRDNAYEDKDLVAVVDDAGQVQPDRIPKAWLGTDLAPGMKKATARQQAKEESADDGGGGGSETPSPASGGTT